MPQQRHRLKGSAAFHPLERRIGIRCLFVLVLQFVHWLFGTTALTDAAVTYARTLLSYLSLGRRSLFPLLVPGVWYLADGSG